MIMGYNEKPKNGNQNMPTNRPYIASFLTSLAPIDSPESQLLIGAKLVKNGEIECRFVDMFLFLYSYMSLYFILLLLNKKKEIEINLA